MEEPESEPEWNCDIGTFYWRNRNRKNGRKIL